MTNTNKYTHPELVQIAEKWVKKNGFAVVASELKTVIREIPDVVGFSASASIIIECKCSKSDFRADFKKPERIMEGKGIGNYRLYLAEKGVLCLDSIPEKWGLLEVNEKGKVEVIRFKMGNIYVGNSAYERDSFSRLDDEHSQFHHLSNTDSERSILFSILRRLKK